MVAEGYKDTDIGVIPVEWEVKQIKDFSIIATGNTPPTKDVDNYGNDYAWITPTDIGKKKDIYCGERSLSVQGYSKARQLPKDTVLITSIASIGKNAILRVQGACNQQINAILPSNNHISEYVYYWFENNINTVMSLAGQTAVLMINKTDFSKIKIPLPPLKEQEKIADILSTADAKIDAIQIQIEKAETLKKGLLQKLLSEGIGHSEFKDSELGKIPEGWEVGKLEDISDFITKGATPTTYGFDWEETGIPFLRSECVSDNGLVMKAAMFISDEAHKHMNRSEIKNGDLLITITGNVGRVILLQDDISIGNINQHIARIRISSNQVDNKFIYQYLSQDKYRLNYYKITTGQAYPQISLKQVRNSIVPLPLLKEQKQIADILSTADEKLEVLRAKKEKYETLKKGLLQKLLSGEVRV